MSSISREKLAPCLSVTDWGMSSDAPIFNAYPFSSDQIKVQHYTPLTNQRPALHSTDQSEASASLPSVTSCDRGMERHQRSREQWTPSPLSIICPFHWTSDFFSTSYVYFIFYGVFNVELYETEKNVHKFKHHSLNKSISCLHSRAIQTVSTMRNLQQIEIQYWVSTSINICGRRT